MGLGKFWPDLEIAEAFVMGLEISFSGDFVSRRFDFLSLGLEFGNQRKVSNLTIYTPVL